MYVVAHTWKTFQAPTVIWVRYIHIYFCAHNCQQQQKRVTLKPHVTISTKLYVREMAPHILAKTISSSITTKNTQENGTREMNEKKRADEIERYIYRGNSMKYENASASAGATLESKDSGRTIVYIVGCRIYQKPPGLVSVWHFPYYSFGQPYGSTSQHSHFSHCGTYFGRFSELYHSTLLFLFSCFCLSEPVCVCWWCIFGQPQ